MQPLHSKFRFAGSGFLALILIFVMSAGAVKADERYWFFFTDKGPGVLQKHNEAAAMARISAKALARRAKSDPGAPLIDHSDWPVHADYIAALQGLGIEPRVVSRWLNAVSATASPQQVQSARQLTCIGHIQKVATFRKPLPDAALSKEAALHYSDMEYGTAFIQNDLVQLTGLHKMGYLGQGVLIAVFDTGFRLNHEALDSMKVVAQYDFINNDFVTDNETGDLNSQINHGTWVLSVIAAEEKGKMIGAAPKAEFLLAKTEDVSQEVEAEEDHWIAAAEWAEGLGADIITSSLGYIDWYTYSDMDGNTAPITRVADLAVKKGIVVVTSAGNEGNGPWQYVSAPADGDSVLAIGAVDRTGTLASFSSRGPTYDGRIKPDVVTMGVGVTCIAVPPAEGVGSGYITFSGTSAACPIAAGAVALILCAQPELKPMEIVTALRATASRNQQPDNDFGWGLVQTLTALRALTPAVEIPREIRLSSIFPNPLRGDGSQIITVQLDLVEETHVEIGLYNILGQKACDLFRGLVLAGKGRLISMTLPADLTRRLGSGTCFLRVRYGGRVDYRAITLLSGFSTTP